MSRCKRGCFLRSLDAHLGEGADNMAQLSSICTSQHASDVACEPHVTMHLIKMEKAQHAEHSLQLDLTNQNK